MMKLINSTNWCGKKLTVKQIKITDGDGFTEFMYLCQCGAKHVDVYVNKGNPISKMRKICKWCGITNIVLCRKTVRQ